MRTISDGYAYGMLTNEQFRQNIDTIVTHQETDGEQETHRACGGFIVQQAHRLAHLYYSPVRFRHDEANANHRFGHIPEADWGEVGVYVSARQRIVPTNDDLAQFEAFHAENPHAIYGIAAPTPLGTPNILLMRHSQEKPFIPEELQGWDEDQKVVAAIGQLVAAGINCRLRGPAEERLPRTGPLTAQALYL
jgi:hypothetical protein